MKFVQDFKFGFRLHQKIAIVFILIFIAYTVVTGVICIYFLKYSLFAEEHKKLDLQVVKFVDALNNLHKKSNDQLSRFTNKHNLENSLVQIATQGPFYNISDRSIKPLNNFRKANMFQHQYNFFTEMHQTKESSGLCLFQLYLLSPHQYFKEISPQLFISIEDVESSIYLFDYIGKTQNESFYGDSPQLTPMSKDEFSEVSSRIKFSGFDMENVQKILSTSGFDRVFSNKDKLRSVNVLPGTSRHEKQLMEGGIVLRFEYFASALVFNPVTNLNEHTPVAILVSEKMIDKQWLTDLKNVTGSDYGFFQDGRLILSTVGISDTGKKLKKDDIIEINSKSYLCSVFSTPFQSLPDGDIYPGVLLDTDYIFDTIFKISLLIGCSTLCLLISTLFISRQIIMYLVGKPVMKFLSVVEHSLKGDLTQRVTVKSKDEIGFLGNVFNHMTSGIHKAMSEEREANKKLKRANKYIKRHKVSLKKKVRERTKELNYKNAKLKKTVQQLNLSRVEAESASKTKSEFIANISHEIRTPMNAIIGFADLLGRKVTDTQQKKYVHSIISGGKSLQQLIDDLLDLSKIEAGKMEINEHPVNLSEVCNEIGKIFSLSIQEKGLVFKYSIDPKLPDYILFDEIRLRQILFNLIGNAIKFTEVGYVELKFEQILINTDGSQNIVLTVKDSGIGIPPDQYTYIFEAFCQKKGQKGMGTGLGLTITKRLAKMMRGVVKIDSNGKKGTRFRIRFKGVVASSGDKPILLETPIKTETIKYNDRAHKSPVSIEQSSIKPDSQDISKLLLFLQKELFGLWEQAKDFFIMNDIAIFAETIIELGNDYQVPFLSSWGTDLYDQAINFDMETLPVTLNMYPKLITQISQLLQSSEETYEFQ